MVVIKHWRSFTVQIYSQSNRHGPDSDISVHILLDFKGCHLLGEYSTWVLMMISEFQSDSVQHVQFLYGECPPSLSQMWTLVLAYFIWAAGTVLNWWKRDDRGMEGCDMEAKWGLSGGVCFQPRSNEPSVLATLYTHCRPPWPALLKTGLHHGRDASHTPPPSAIGQWTDVTIFFV